MYQPQLYQCSQNVPAPPPMAPVAVDVSMYQPHVYQFSQDMPPAPPTMTSLPTAPHPLQVFQQNHQIPNFPHNHPNLTYGHINPPLKQYVQLHLSNASKMNTGFPQNNTSSIPNYIRNDSNAPDYLHQDKGTNFASGYVDPNVVNASNVSWRSEANDAGSTHNNDAADVYNQDNIAVNYMQQKDQVSNAYDGNANNLSSGEMMHQNRFSNVCQDRLSAGFSKNSYAQAVDGRYTSIYKTTYCHLKPTSPPQELTEFPPQCPQIRHDAEFYPRFSTEKQQDSFAKSLRSYRISPDRSSELFERLISYSQAKNWKGPVHNMNRSADQAGSDRVRPSRSPERSRSRREESSLSPTSSRSPPRERKAQWVRNPELERNAFNNIVEIRELTEFHRDCRSGRHAPVSHSNCSIIHEASESDELDINNLSTMNSQVQAPKLEQADVAHDETETFKRFKNIRPSTELEWLPTKSKSSEQILKPRLNRDLAIRRIKSWEEVTKGYYERQGDLVKWLQKVYSVNKAMFCEIKLQWLIDQLKQPGCKKKLMKQVYKQMKKLHPQNCKDKKQINNLVEELLQLRTTSENNQYSFDGWTKNNDSNVQAESQIRMAVRDWLKLVKVLNKDSLGRLIKEEDILNYMPFVLNRPTLTSDYKCLLKSYISQIIDEMPLDKNLNNPPVVEDNLVNELLIDSDKTSENYIERKDSVTDVNQMFERQPLPAICEQPIVKEVSEFILDETKQFSERFYVHFSEDVFVAVERQLNEIFLGAIKAFGINDDDIKDDIFETIQIVGKLPEYQAKHFTKTLFRRFKEVFGAKLACQEKKANDQYQYLYFGNDYEVYCNPVNQMMRSYDPTEQRIKENLDWYYRTVTDEIDLWLSDMTKDIPLADRSSFRDMVTADLVDEIVRRQKHFQQFRLQGDETKKQIKYVVQRWLKRIIGEGNPKIKKRACTLIDRLKAIETPILVRMKNYDPDSNRSCDHHMPNKMSQDTSTATEKLYAEIHNWFRQLPKNMYSKSNDRFTSIVWDSAETLNKRLKLYDNAVELIEKEIKLWMKLHILKRKPDKYVIERLRNKIESIETGEIAYKPKTSLQVPHKRSSTSYTEFIGLANERGTHSHLDRVTKQIKLWIREILPQSFDEPFTDHAAYELGEEIVDRQKYLDMNPWIRSSESEELEHLKYQVFKALKKIVGEDALQFIESTYKLKQRLQNLNKTSLLEKDKYNYLPGPSQVRSQKEVEIDKVESIVIPGKLEKTAKNNVLQLDEESSENYTFHKPRGRNTVQEVQKSIMNFPGVSINEESAFTTVEGFGAIADRKSYERVILSNDTLCSDEFVSDRKPFLYQQTSYSKDKNSNESGVDNSNDGYSFKFDYQNFIENWVDFNSTGVSSGHHKNIPNKQSENTEISLKQTYDVFDRKLKEKCHELLMHNVTPDQKVLANIAVQRIYNGIWKTFFRLQSESSIQHDELPEAMVENKLDMVLDCQIDAILQISERWKSDVATEIIKLMTQVRKLTSKPSYKCNIIAHVYRHLFNEYYKYQHDTRHDYIINAVESYIIFKRFIDQDMCKTGLYKDRLMRRLREFADYLKRDRKEMSFLTEKEICQRIFDILESVGIPDFDTLKNEADEILISDEIEDWCQSLPVKMETNECHDKELRQMKIYLTRKLHEIEKARGFDDCSAEREAKRNVCSFIRRYVTLQSVRYVDYENFELSTEIDKLMERLKQISTFRGYPKCKAHQTDPVSYLSTLVGGQSVGVQATKSPFLERGYK